MASLLEKIQTLISADLNRLVDRALSSQRRGGVPTSHPRPAELAGAVDRATGQPARRDHRHAPAQRRAAGVGGAARSGGRRAASGRLQEDALAAQERLNQSRLLAGRLVSKVERLETEYAKLAETKAELDARIIALVQSEPEVEGLMGLARAKQLTAAAGQSLEDLAGSGDPDVARVVGSIRDRLAEAEAQIQMLEQSALAHGETPEVLKRKELEAQLEARKARLGVGN